MSAAVKLARMVVRVEPGLNIALTDLASRLFEESSVEHSHAAIIRGLVALDLASIANAARLAPSFVGVRVLRGRKPGTPLASRSARTASRAPQDW